MRISNKERDWIFDKLNKIQQIVGTKISIIENNIGNNSSANPFNNIIRIGTEHEFINEYIAEGKFDLNKHTCGNIDNFNNDVDYDQYYKVKPFIKTFLHELSHCLTIVNMDDAKLYNIHKNNNGGIFISAEDYRKLPFEKLADNLAYMLWKNNQEIIEAILYDEDYEITQERVSDNLKLANRMKRQYIPEYASGEIV